MTTPIVVGAGCTSRPAPTTSQYRRAGAHWRCSGA